MGKMLKVLLLALLVTVATLAPAGAVTEVKTKFVSVQGVDFAPPNGTWDQIYGQIGSKKDKCLPDRTVSIKWSTDRHLHRLRDGSHGRLWDLQRERKRPDQRILQGFRREGKGRQCALSREEARRLLRLAHSG